MQDVCPKKQSKFGREGRIEADKQIKRNSRHFSAAFATFASNPGHIDRKTREGVLLYDVTVLRKRYVLQLSPSLIRRGPKCLAKWQKKQNAWS
jgi:hypothetical protein